MNVDVLIRERWPTYEDAAVELLAPPLPDQPSRPVVRRSAQDRARDLRQIVALLGRAVDGL